MVCSDRNKEIVDQYLSGLSMDALARAYALSNQRIQQIVSKRVDKEVIEKLRRNRISMANAGIVRSREFRENLSRYMTDKHSSTWTDVRVERLRELSLADPVLSIGEIARILGMRINQVRGKAWRMGFTFRPQSAEERIKLRGHPRPSHWDARPLPQFGETASHGTRSLDDRNSCASSEVL